MGFWKRIGQWFCSHDWQAGGPPTEYVSAFSIFAGHGSAVDEYRAYRQGYSCSKCRAWKVEEWDNGALRGG